jgi:uncharacterized membrane protein YkoI
MIDGTKRFLILGFAATTLVHLATPALAEDDESDDDGDDGADSSGNGGASNQGPENGNGHRHSKDQDRAKHAVANGKAVPLVKLKDFLAQNYPGKILRINLVRRLGSYVYHVRILQSGNRLKSYSFDASTLQEKLF